MWQRKIYLRAGRRRPVAVGIGLAEDPQAALPAWWCERCGAEVYTMDAVLCRRCLQQKEELSYEKEASGS